MPRIFINYRREDSRADAGRIYDRLKSHFGASNVFMDTDSLEPGVDFVEALRRTVGSCDVFLAVLGNQWLAAKDEQGRTRLSNPDDFVALEIAAALERPGIRVVPILVGGANMPRSRELPDGLRNLTRRQALDLPEKGKGFHQALGHLIESIERAEQERLAQQKAEAEQAQRLAQQKAEQARFERKWQADKQARLEQARLEEERKQKRRSRLAKACAVTSAVTIIILTAVLAWAPYHYLFLPHWLAVPFGGIIVYNGLKLAYIVYVLVANW